MKNQLRIVTLLLLGAAVMLLLYVWGELLHRWLLYRSYGSEPYMNHVGASYFVSMPRYAIVGVFLAAAALVFALLQRRIAIALLCCVLVASGFYAPRLLRSFHEQRKLVTYEEFTERFFRQHVSP